MILSKQVPLTDPEKNQLKEWMSHPGRMVYQKCLAAQAAELTAEASAMILKREYQDDESTEKEAKERFDKARVMLAAKNFLDQHNDKDYKWYVVTLSPDTTTKN